MMNFIRETVAVVLAGSVGLAVGLLIVMRCLLRDQKKHTAEIVKKIEEIDSGVQESKKAIGLIKLGLEELSKKDPH